MDYLRRRGVHVMKRPMHAASKSETFARLRARLNTGGLALPDDPQLLRELRSLRTRYAAGAASVVTPRIGGGHADIAQAVALAVAELDRHSANADSQGSWVVDTSPITGELGNDHYSRTWYGL